MEKIFTNAWIKTNNLFKLYFREMKEAQKKIEEELKE